MIYLAAVVRDADLVTGDGQVTSTDAMEVYIDGLLSERTMAEPRDDWWPNVATTAMPVLQYVGLPSNRPAYGDHDRANPALMYGDTARTATRMAYRRTGDHTTYEWAVQPFDHYPDRPPRLYSGGRLGLDIAIVDRDRDCAWPSLTTWGNPQRVFKGFDASELGELVLDGRP